MRYRLVARHQKRGTVRRLCGLLGVSASGYYAWRQPERESARVREDRRLSQKIRASHLSSRQRYGRPRVHRDLREQGERCSRKRVERLMRQEGLRARSRRRYRITTDSRHSHPIAGNLLDRRFSVDRANQVWVSDITYLWTPEGFVYLAAVLDLYSRRVVGWSLGNRLDQDLPLRALRQALEHRRPARGLDSP
jgi:putative transposase